MELLLALITADPAGALHRVSHTPLLARRTATHLQVHAPCFDTQTPDATPCFVTTFERTRWRVRRRDGSVVDLALDVGQLVAGTRSAPLCELALTLVAGKPQALFAVAQQLAHSLPVLPLHTSKTERGYALAAGTLHQPRGAQPPKLQRGLALPEAARRVLREMLCQFTANLHTLRHANDPEVVHQARVGWRRFRSALRLFKPVLAADALPPRQALEPLLEFLGELRDLDVAQTDTLPPLAQAYAQAGGAAGADQAGRERAWQHMTQALDSAAVLQRKAVRYALEKPTVGACLLAFTEWLEGPLRPTSSDPAAQVTDESLRHWARRRIARQHKRLQLALKSAQRADDPQLQHRVRLLSKRLRYSIEALRHVLPKQPTRQWQAQAAQLQSALGATRDLERAAQVIGHQALDSCIAEFFRGVAVARKMKNA